MISNYHYFLVLAEELNISNAAKRLYISHQCLSKYLKGLEEAYGVTFFERKPKFSLTHAGNIMLKTLREIERSEQNLESQLADIKESKSGVIKFGITEGRYPIIIPRLLKEYRDRYPNVELTVYSMTSPQMQELVLNNELDLFFAGTGNLISRNLKHSLVLNEHMYLVISDNLLRQYFPEDYPGCISRFEAGVDLALLQQVPFVLNKPNFNSRIMLERHLQRRGITINCVNELTQPDIHYRLCAEDYAASFCLTMYLPGVSQLNQLGGSGSRLHVFPIKDFKQVNPLSLIYHKDKIFPSYTQDFMKLIREICDRYAAFPQP